MVREIVSIDESKCDGCGLCVPACHEGAIRIENGKARLVAERLCDGLGDCLGQCPRGAITIERRAAQEFDELAVAARQEQLRAASMPHRLNLAPEPTARSTGCPGSRVRSFNSTPTAPTAPAESPQSELTHWPVQINLLPPQAPVFKNANLLITADCVPVAYAGFHANLLRGRRVVMGCPKLDDVNAYAARLTEIFASHELHEIVVARMEVPCCVGLTQAVLAAARRAQTTARISEAIISTQGELLPARPLQPNT